MATKFIEYELEENQIIKIPREEIERIMKGLGVTEDAALAASAIHSCDNKFKRTRLSHNRRVRMRVNSGFFLGLGQSALHIAATQATGAHVHPLRRTIDHHTNALHIGRPGAMALAVGVADVVAVQRALLANLTKLSHEIHLLIGVTHIKAYLIYHGIAEKARDF